MMILTNRQKMLDTSDELCVVRYNHGVKLARPDQMNSVLLEKSTRVADLMRLPFCVFFLDQKSVNKNVNEHIAALGDYESAQAALGKSALDYVEYHAAKKIIQNSARVMCDRQPLIVDESGYFSLIKKYIDALCIKLPWFNSNNESIGLLGFAAVSGTHSLSSFINTLVNLRLLNNSKIVGAREVENVFLTAREKEIAEYVMHGCTAKEIAKVLLISPRTVEKYIENIKMKLNVSRKEALIEKLQEWFI